MKYTATIAVLASSVAAFPFVLDVPGVDSRPLMWQRRQAAQRACPFNPNHVPAAPVTPQFVYNNASNGQKGNQKGGYLVPHPDDKAHRFIAPNPKTDIRGPCPGLNAAANHGFLARDGITTFNELVDAQQNVYNVGYDLAQTLALLGLTLTDGDIVTEKLSIGCDATSRTSYNPVLTGHEPGLDGHNKFEGDTSLTRNDYFLGHGDDYSLNTTLFQMMAESTGGNFSFAQLAKYRQQRYMQSRHDNPNFYYGPLSLLLYGAASFLYELMPSGTRGYAADLYTISYFFGVKPNADGSYSASTSRIPPNWTNRVSPFTNFGVGDQIISMYSAYPVAFGGNTGNGTFDVLDGWGGLIQNGTISSPVTPQQTTCLLYQLLTERVPSSLLGGVLDPTVAALNLINDKVGLHFANLGCPQPLTR